MPLKGVLYMDEIIKAYSIKDMRKKVFNSLAVKNRQDIADFISIRNLFVEISIKNYYVDIDKKECYIPFMDFMKLCSYINTNYETNYHISSFNSVDVNGTDFTIIRSADHAEYLDATFQYMTTHSTYKKHFFDSVFLKELKMNKTITAFDFSYDKNQNIVDVGISYFDKNIQKNYHFIVEENMPEQFSENTKYFSFNFGKTEVKKLSTIKDFISLFTNQADVILLHDSTNDMKVIEALGMAELFANKKIIDTSLLLSDVEPIVELGRVVNPNERVSLKNLLLKSKISYSQLHNSGNDAFYTLKAFLKNIKNKAL